MPLYSSNEQVERILTDLKQASDEASRRIFWLTFILVIQTSVLLVLTGWLVFAE